MTGSTCEQVEEFKSCRVCGEVWRDISDFILDPALRVEGYQACFANPPMGLVMVTHCNDDCGTTLAIKAQELKALYNGPEHLQRHTGGERCHSYCLQHNILEECDVDCDMAWARQALQWLRRRQLPPHMSERGQNEC